jgi:drug/metabolite transporter (DMT)-like permease
MPWLPLTLLCALSLATADAVTKRYLSDYTSTELLVIRFAVTALILAPAFLVLPVPEFPSQFWGWLLLLVPLEIIAMLLYVRAIRDSPLSLTLPYLAFTPVFAVLIGYLFLGEMVSAKGLMGIVLVVVGAYLLNIEQLYSSQGRDLCAPLRAIARNSGSRIMLFVAMIYSVTSVAGKGALQYVSASFFGVFYFSLLGTVVLIGFFTMRPRQLRLLWRRPLVHFTVGALMAVMVITHFLAISEVEVAYMIAVKRTSLIFGIIYGAFLFKEKQLGSKLVAGALMVAGVALVSI